MLSHTSLPLSLAVVSFVAVSQCRSPVQRALGEEFLALGPEFLLLPSSLISSLPSFPSFPSPQRERGGKGGRGDRDTELHCLSVTSSLTNNQARHVEAELFSVHTHQHLRGQEGKRRRSRLAPPQNPRDHRPLRSTSRGTWDPALSVWRRPLWSGTALRDSPCSNLRREIKKTCRSASPATGNKARRTTPARRPHEMCAWPACARSCVWGPPLPWGAERRGGSALKMTLAFPCSRSANLPICVCPVAGRSGLQTDSQGCPSWPHAGRPRAGMIAVLGTHRRLEAEKRILCHRGRRTRHLHRSVWKRGAARITWPLPIASSNGL